MVAAALSFAASAYPQASLSHIRDVMLQTVTKNDNYTGKSISDGTLNLGAMMKALEAEYGPKITVTVTGNIVANTNVWTNNSVVLTLTTNVPVNTPTGWTQTSPTTFTKNIDQNGSISVSFSDSSGNSGTASYNVTNIDKNIPQVTITSPANL